MNFVYDISSEFGFNDVEFDFISQYMHNKKNINLCNGSEFKLFINNTAEIRKEIQISNLIKYSAYSESSSTGVFIEDPDDLENFQYSYQRYDLKFRYKNWLNKIYGIQNASFISDGLFVASGMSALFVSIMSLKHLYSEYTQTYISKDGYFEIDNMLNKYTHLFNKKYFEEGELCQADIVILDSSSTDLPRKETWIDAKIIIIDTTCWEPGNSTLEYLLTTLENHQGIMILIRSHIKLDCFGLEVSRLGSIVVLSSKNTNIATIGDLEAFQKVCQELNGNIGSNFSLFKYYPWLAEKQFHNICRNRTQKIRLYSKLIADKVISGNISGFEVIKPQHGLFMLIKFLKNKPTDPLQFKKRIREICSFGNENGIAITPAPSFALCYTTFDGFKNNFDNEVYLRICPSPNMHLNQMEKIGDFLTQVLSNYNFKTD
jgi:hypothetical protein